jgi:hypothetical protein
MLFLSIWCGGYCYTWDISFWTSFKDKVYTYNIICKKIYEKNK